MKSRRRRTKEKKKVGENNGQLRFVCHHVLRTQTRLDQKRRRKEVVENNGQLRFVCHHVWRTQARLNQLTKTCGMAKNVKFWYVLVNCSVTITRIFTIFGPLFLHFEYAFVHGLCISINKYFLNNIRYFLVKLSYVCVHVKRMLTVLQTPFSLLGNQS